MVGLLALAGVAAPASGLSTDRHWRSPVSPLHVERPFDPPAHDWLPGHRGVDLAAHVGQEVRAGGGGRVTFAADLAGRGVVVVDHGAVRTTYQPVQASVSVGDHVRTGERIGVIAVGAGHCGSGGCLHLGLRRGKVYLDPLLVVMGAVAVLRPW
jgi:murein DD-endopeptidase MepM/ murein hydrolase activator NlpD